MTEKQKKVNWTADERDMLISRCEETAVATGKFSSSLTAADKTRFWEDVTECVNSVSQVKRTLDQVKKKWVDLKSQTKRKTIAHMSNIKKTGGGPAPVLGLEEWESKVLQTIPSCSVEGIKNGTDTFIDNADDIPEAQLPVGSMTAGNENAKGVSYITSKADYIKTTESVSRKRQGCDDASISKTSPLTKKARSQKNSVEELVMEQTAVMKELIDAVTTLNSSVNSLSNNLEKYNHFSYDI